MENYEKKYKEALCWIRKIYPTMNDCDKEDAERHFPELKESEDERISNAIMCYITDYSDGCSMICVNGVTRNEAVAWLEKQGKQKPAWSEKDEKMLKETLALIETVEDINKAKDGFLDVKMWLKSLKDKHFPQSKQRQDEDITDEELIQARKDAYNDALDKIEYHSDTPTFIDGWSAAIWYLKKRNAIPSQKRWKPSDEQLAALNYVCRSYNPPATEKIAWDSLKNIEIMYGQLKKLKEKQP